MQHTDIEVGKDVLHKKAKALVQLAETLDDTFVKAVDLILSLKSHLVICGVGKSGLVGKKMSATLSSTGTPSFFMHPTEAYHGDLGMITPGCAVVLISNSGETSELTQLLPWLSANKIPVIAMTGSKTSTLAQAADVCLEVRVESEICPNGLAPTASTTATISMGDALAVALMLRRNFTAEDFARYHPGGSLGRRLLGRVYHFMKEENIPTISAQSNVKDVVMRLANSRIGLAIVVDEDLHLLGVITDGDVRRLMQRVDDHSLFSVKAVSFMNTAPVCCRPDQSLVEAEDLLKKHKIQTLVVTDSLDIRKPGKVLGYLDQFDLN